MERLLNISRKSTTPFPLVSEEGVQAANDHRCQLELLRVGVGILNQAEHSPLEDILREGARLVTIVHKSHHVVHEALGGVVLQGEDLLHVAELHHEWVVRPVCEHRALSPAQVPLLEFREVEHPVVVGVGLGEGLLRDCNIHSQIPRRKPPPAHSFVDGSASYITRYTACK